MEEQQQLPKTNAEWANYYESIIAELSDNQKKIGEPISIDEFYELPINCLLYTSPSPRDLDLSRMPSSA